MAAWTSATVIAIAPEFSGVAAGVFTFWIDMAQRQIDDRVFGDRAVDAGAFLTAHLMTVFNALGGVVNATGGQVTGVTVGQVSVTYAQVQNAGALGSLSQSKYGMQFLDQIQLSCAGVMVI